MKQSICQILPFCRCAESERCTQVPWPTIKFGCFEPCNLIYGRTASIRMRSGGGQSARPDNGSPPRLICPMVLAAPVRWGRHREVCLIHVGGSRLVESCSSNFVRIHDLRKTVFSLQDSARERFMFRPRYLRGERNFHSQSNFEADGYCA
jgi:hypothetical protein